MTDFKNTKFCRKCNFNKKASDFHKRPNSETLQSWCKKCTAESSNRKRLLKDKTIRPKDVTRFFSKIEKTDYCWNWIKRKLPKGYGTFNLNEAPLLSHRFSYLYHFGNLPDELDVLHTCDNPSCVNPKHLFLGTNQDNIDDMVAKGRQRKGEQINFAKLNETQVLEIRQLASNGQSISSLARQYQVARGTIRFIITRTTWKHI